nr:MAG TPA: hypothetical protein [Caudoviricetes sp.]
MWSQSFFLLPDADTSTRNVEALAFSSFPL